ISPGCRRATIRSACRSIPTGRSRKSRSTTTSPRSRYTSRRRRPGSEPGAGQEGRPRVALIQIRENCAANALQFDPALSEGYPVGVERHQLPFDLVRSPCRGAYRLLDARLHTEVADDIVEPGIEKAVMVCQPGELRRQVNAHIRELARKDRQLGL